MDPNTQPEVNTRAILGSGNKAQVAPTYQTPYRSRIYTLSN